MIMVKFGYTILYVNDVTKSVDFYESSFDFVRRFITPENDYAEMETGGTTLAFASLALGKSNLKAGFQESSVVGKPFGIELAFSTDNVQTTLEKAQKQGAVLVEPPVVKPWGQTVAYILDIDGFLIELCTVIDVGD